MSRLTNGETRGVRARDTRRTPGCAAEDAASEPRAEEAGVRRAEDGGQGGRGGKGWKGSAGHTRDRSREVPAASSLGARDPGAAGMSGSGLICPRATQAEIVRLPL